MIRLELACKSQLAAMACGVPLVEVPGHVIEETHGHFAPEKFRPNGYMEWPSMLRGLDRIDDSYRN